MECNCVISVIIVVSVIWPIAYGAWMLTKISEYEVCVFEICTH